MLGAIGIEDELQDGVPEVSINHVLLFAKLYMLFCFRHL